MDTENSERFRNKMKQVRDIYGLNKTDMSRVCGFGANTWRRYEAGKATPESSNKKLIEQTFKPHGMAKLLEMVSDDERAKMGYRWDNAINKALRYAEGIEQQATEYKSKLANNFLANDYE